jgi:hypothetical protein
MEPLKLGLLDGLKVDSPRPNSNIIAQLEIQMLSEEIWLKLI